MTTAVNCFSRDTASATPLTLLTPDTLKGWHDASPDALSGWASAAGFTAKPGTSCLLPKPDGTLAGVLVGADLEQDPFSLGALPGCLPPGCYRLPGGLAPRITELAHLGFGMGTYRYARYRASEDPGVRLALDDGAASGRLHAILRAVFLARDLINTPAQDLMPPQLAGAAEELASEFGADYECFTGEDLITRGFPSVHAVGRASSHAPRLIRLGWGNEQSPRIALVGKGVCFDSGGLDIKPANGMRLMKKDMGGAAQALGLARLIMETGLDVRLDLIVPAVENAISGNAMRPGDVLNTRKGLTVEVDNTDAEGRLILSDALTLACEQSPALVVDFATLTGAARVAVGTDLAAMFCNDDAMAEGIESGAAEVNDPVWRMPLYKPYNRLIKSRIADIVNSSGTPYAGSVTAALFLARFVETGIPWAHFDIMAWNPRARPGHPEGGEAMALRAVFDYLESRFRS